MTGRIRRTRQQTLSWGASPPEAPLVPRASRRGRGSTRTRRGRSSTSVPRTSRRNLQPLEAKEPPKEKEVQDEKMGVSLDLKNRINSRLNDFFADLGSDMEDEVDIDISLPSIKAKNGENEENKSEKKDKKFYTLPDSDEDNVETKSDLDSLEMVDKKSENVIAESSVIANDCGPSTSKMETDIIKDSTANDSFTAFMNIIGPDVALPKTTEKENNRSSTSEFDSMLKSADDILKEVNAELSAAMTKKEPTPPLLAGKQKESNLTCPICLETLGGAVKACSTHCGHLFCQECIYRIIDLTKKCPTCRKGLSKKKVVPLFL